ncbi:hypothetical protein CC1G_11232 [Coprinopsis cinerea okayama7|uniref:Uncharacterized protein n=1 Tax=Coprinopsis cinerea (strain Okayama-7 / 130 / ATCC MYA-4618 / FGSC 9003) TaxID=240176 RepID=A8N131_COPC7|nr:hypothetical protein CC1G_11232 [Coprinopsis cinerea okayama7\|eukprot:XP_001828580.2 hypothetical protein CC1G_11232 [Coprinopsis cinerea okayama7\
MATPTGSGSRWLSLDEFNDLVSASLAPTNADIINPESAEIPKGGQMISPENTRIEVPDVRKTNWNAVSIPGTSTSCLSPSSPFVPFNNPSLKPTVAGGLSPNSRLSSLPLRRKFSPRAGWKSRGPPVVDDSTINWQLEPFLGSSEIMANPSVSTSTLSTVDTRQCPGLPGSSTNGRKPIALLQKLKRQASALVKPSSSTPKANTSSSTSRGNHPYLTDSMGGMSRPPFDRMVSFAPTPAHSVSTYSTSIHSRSSIDDDSSFLDYGDEHSFSMRRLRHGKSMPTLTLFRNRNANFVHNGIADASQDDLRSVMTSDTAETTTEEATSTESGDFIPYIPLVLQHERGMKPLQLNAAGESRNTSRRNNRRNEDTPSPTQSNSDGSESTHSPITPKTPFFAQNGSISVSSDDDETESISSSFVASDHDVALGNSKKSELLRQRSFKSNSHLYSSPFASSRRSSSPSPLSRYQSSPHPFARVPGQSSEDDNLSQRERKKPSKHLPVEDDRVTIATTSESCYSMDSYGYSRPDPLSSFKPHSPTPTATTFITALEDPGFPSSLEVETDDEFMLPSQSRRSIVPPSIRIEDASGSSDLSEPTPTAANMPKPSEPVWQNHSTPEIPKIGVGRQTVDPKVIQSPVKESQPKEWTLLLGAKNDDLSKPEPRPRTRSAVSRDIKSRITALQESGRARTQSAATPRRAQEARDVIGAITSSPARFSPDKPSPKPLLRVQPIIDTDASDSEADPFHNDFTSGEVLDKAKEQDRLLRRSGSAQPFVGARKDSELTDPIDWTLMLPLPMPQSKYSVARLPDPPTEISASRAGSRRRSSGAITKARSSVDLTAGMNKDPWGTKSNAKTEYSSLKSIKKELEKLEETNAKLESRRKAREDTRLREEEYLAAILGDSEDNVSDNDNRQSGDSSEMGGESSSGESYGNVIAVTEKERDDHRQRALDTLSGRSTPCLGKAMAAAEGEVPEVPSLPKNLDIPSSGEGSRSSGSSDGQFEERLVSLLQDKEQVEQSESPKNTETSESRPMAVENHQPPSKLKDNVPKATRPSLKANTSIYAFPSTSSPLSSPTRLAIGASKPIYVPPAGYLPYSRPNSLTTRAPIGPSRDSQGLSFSQYGPHASAQRHQPKGKTLVMPSTIASVVTPGSKVSKAARPGTAQTIKGNATPHTTDDGDRVSICSVKSTASSSSTDTVVPSTSSRRGSAQTGPSGADAAPDVSTAPSKEEGHDGSHLDIPARERTISTCSSLYDQPLELDFPMPPTFNPAVTNRTSPDLTIPQGSLRLTMTPPMLRRQPSCGETLGLDEDIELPPPTPLQRSSPHKNNSPRKASPRTSPIPHGHPHPAPTLSASDPSMSGWEDDGDDDEQDDENSESEDGDTVYLSMSEDDYEDAVSMLSGMFYSARSSMDSRP